MAEDETPTSGMLALLPREQDQQRLAVEGGDEPDALHLTLLYLGDDVTSWLDDDGNGPGARLAELLYAAAPSLRPVRGRILGHAEFNPDGGPDGDKPPCAVYLVGSAPGIGELLTWLTAVLTTGDAYETPPEQFDPYVPHITAGYELPASTLTETGEVVFDRLRLALGGVQIDVDLGDQAEDLPDDDGEIDLKWYPRHDLEFKVMSPDPRAARLRIYWARGAGRKKWHDFRSLRRHLAEHVPAHMLNGLTANIYKLATGRWPGRRGGTEHKGHPMGGADVERELYDGVEDWGMPYADEVDSETDAADGEVLTAAELAEASQLGATVPAGLPGVETKAGADQDIVDLERYGLLEGMLRTPDQVDPGAMADDSWEQVNRQDVRFRPKAGGELEPADEDDFDGADAPSVAPSMFAVSPVAATSVIAH